MKNKCVSISWDIWVNSDGLICKKCNEKLNYNFYSKTSRCYNCDTNEDLI